MLRETNFLLFLAASLPLIMTPGPDMIYVATRGISRGRRVALLSASGVGLGYVVHTVLAVAGLSALLQQSATAFLAVKYAGAAYLFYLGVRTLFDKGGFASLRADAGKGRTDDLVRVFFQGTVTSVLNPKGVLFFLAFLPQFVSLSGGSVALQVSVPGSIFACCVCSFMASSATSPGASVKPSSIGRASRVSCIGSRAAYSSPWDSVSPFRSRAREERSCLEK